MRYSISIILILACFAALFLACYYPVLVQDRQFSFRDAGYYYYPLYQRVQREWEAGRWPLWEPEENAGMPLIGNPTAAVLYPGKLIYAVFPYAWAARVYVLTHSALAFGAMLVLLRSWRVSWAGSGLGALAYTFGMPILFAYSNVIYLVGAAWLPLGFHAVDRWARLGRRWGLIELSVVLAMQTLGGDPQSSYLLGVAGFGYAAGLAWSQRRAVERPRGQGAEVRSAGSFVRWRFPAVGLAIASWVVLTPILAGWLPTLRPKGFPPAALPWMRHVAPGVAIAWLLAGSASLVRWRSRGSQLRPGITCLGLAGSAGLAVALSAAQLLPVYEFSQQTTRAANEGVHDIYPFNIAPPQVFGILWPDVLGIQSDGNTYWGDALRMPGDSRKVWIPSLYMGCLILMLAMVALSLRRPQSWRTWLAGVLVVSVLGSLGKYTSPIWAARALAEVTGLPVLQDQVRRLGPLDSDDATPIRLDGFLRDGDGGIYWWMTTLLPGFRQFRYPAKLYTFAGLALAALAGLGWDDLRERGTRRATAISALLLASSLAVLAGVLIKRPAILEMFRRSREGSVYGPFDPEGAFAMMVRSLAQSAIVLALALIAITLLRRRPLWAGALALAATTGDLAAANARHVLTVPQALFETRPEAMRILEEFEAAHPTPGPFRVHRMFAWVPPRWTSTPSNYRERDVIIWERDTLMAKYGINDGIEYAHTLGTANLYDYEWYFGGFLCNVDHPRMSRALNVPLGTPIAYFPRRTFDMWNTRYFVLPMFPNGWGDVHRGYASFLLATEQIYPDPASFGRPGGASPTDWMNHPDFQIRRNLRVHPRAWVVHGARPIAPISGLSRDERKLPMLDILYENDEIWHDPTLRTFNPWELAWVEKAQFQELAPYLPRGSPSPSESVQVSYSSPQRVEIDAALDAAGLVVLADVYYPGWELTIDGEPAPIYRVNRIMRGAAVPAGKHHLVYTYSPSSFRVGRMISVAGLGLLALLGVACTFHPVDPNIGPQLEPTPERPPSISNYI
jgi:hypothetical protein